ncbi:MAG: 5-bromo-4-chloroindolyl phosphate hydrolysis family protein [Anaerovoracaceae bacterium]|nr:5-bromo-4-chloroindolyl phosphate hydrolysis family protein [Anaerovoracaceae bacterium]
MFLDDVYKIIDDAVDSMDFRKLNRDINQTMKKAVFGQAPLDDFKLSEEGRAAGGGFSAEQTSSALPVNKRPKGTVSGVVTMALGISCASAFVTFGAVALYLGAETAAIVFGVLTGVSAAIAAAGNGLRLRVKRFRNYVRKMRGHEFYEIKELAGESGKSPNYVRRDLGRMIDSGMFLEGHIDDSGNWFIGNDTTYEEYLTAREKYKRRKEHPEETRREDEFDAAMREGERYLEDIRNAKAGISDAGVAADISGIEDTAGKIFDRVRRKPALLPEIEKFMSYYLPTTAKLVNVYSEFENGGADSGDVDEAEKEIRETLGSIRQAYDRLLEELYRDDAMDVSADISVLRQMFAKDGLSEDGFGGAKNE